MDNTSAVAEVERRRDQTFAQVKRLQQLVPWRRLFSLEHRGKGEGGREGGREEGEWRGREGRGGGREGE